MRWRVALLLLLSLPWCVHAQTCPGLTTPMTPFAEEILTVSDTPVFLTAATYKDASMATLSVRDGAVTYFLVQTPTATAGHRLGTGVQYPICGKASIQAFRAVRESVDAQLTVTYFRPGP